MTYSQEDCQSKVQHSKKSAQTAVNYHHDKGRILYCYQCPLCNHWHLTHKERNREDRK